MENKGLDITTCESPRDPIIGAHVGVRIRHLPSGIVATSVDKPTQFANKKAALCELRLQLNRYDAIVPVSRFKREMNQVLRNFEKKKWRRILATIARKPAFVVVSSWDSYFNQKSAYDFPSDRSAQYQREKDTLD